MMSGVEADFGPVYRASRPSRGAAWFVLASTATIAIWALVTSPGQQATPALVATGIFSLLAIAVLRLEVRAQPDHLVMCWGGKVRRIPWSDVRGFNIDERTEREIYVLLPDNTRRLLPVVEVATRRTPASQVRDALQAYWRRHRGGR
jgi:hypothetical protein